MEFPVDDRKFPGVSVSTSPRMDRGMDFRATFTGTALLTIPATDVERAAVAGSYGRLADMASRTARSAADMVMRFVSLIVLRRVRRDWTGFFGIRMEIIDHTETLDGKTKKGLTTKVDYRERLVTILWDFNLDGPKEQTYPFDDALDKLQRRDWDLP